MVQSQPQQSQLRPKMNHNHFEGIELTDELYILFQTAMELVVAVTNPHSDVVEPISNITTGTMITTTTTNNNNTNDKEKNNNNDDNETNQLCHPENTTTATATTTDTKNITNVDHHIHTLFDQMTALLLSQNSSSSTSTSTSTPLLTLQEARRLILQQQPPPPPNVATTKKPYYISIPTLRAMETIFLYHENLNTDATITTSSLSNELQRALLPPSKSTTTTTTTPTMDPTDRSSCSGSGSGIVLVYTNSILKHEAKKNDNNNDDDDETTTTTKGTKNTHLTNEQIKFQQRMVQLRLRHDERQYMKLTNNVHRTTIQDDTISTKSMTYAASIGLNMIVAPISFGTLMYFFAGSLLDYFYPSLPSTATTTTTTHYGTTSTTDIKKVMVGVISGVLLLFIEMILFVIRTHELDQAMMKKQKRKNHNQTLSPFGHYKSTTTKTFVDR